MQFILHPKARRTVCKQEMLEESDESRASNTVDKKHETLVKWLYMDELWATVGYSAQSVVLTGAKSARAILVVREGRVRSATCADSVLVGTTEGARRHKTSESNLQAQKRRADDAQTFSEVDQPPRRRVRMPRRNDNPKRRQSRQSSQWLWVALADKRRLAILRSMFGETGRRRVGRGSGFPTGMLRGAVLGTRAVRAEAVKLQTQVRSLTADPMSATKKLASKSVRKNHWFLTETGFLKSCKCKEYTSKYRKMATETLRRKRLQQHEQ